MSDQLAERIKTLALRMMDENIAYPTVLERIAHAMVYIQDLDHDSALRTIKQFLAIEESEATSDISWMMIYFAFYRETKFKQLDPFKSDDFRSLLKDKLKSGNGHLRATCAEHFNAILGRNEIEFNTLVPYLEAMLNGSSNRAVNDRFYQIAAKQAAAHPDTVGHLIERAVLNELKSLDSGGREVWHPKGFSEALQAIERTGPEHMERVVQLRRSIEPYKERKRIFDIYDF